MKRPTIPASSLRKAPEEQYARVPESLIFDSQLKPIEVRVFAGIVNGLWRGNYVHPNLSALAQEIGSSRSQVMRSIAKLKAGGYLQQCPGKIGRSVAFIVTNPLYLKGSEFPVYLNNKQGGRRMV